MADLESELSGLFLTDGDPALAERLADAAVNRIEREDRRRGLVLTAAVATGLGGAGLAIVRSDAIDAARELIAQTLGALPQHLPQPWIWAVATLALLTAAAVTLRPGRTL